MKIGEASKLRSLNNLNKGEVLELS